MESSILFLFILRKSALLKIEVETKKLGGTIKDNMKPYRAMCNSYGRTKTLYKTWSENRMEPVIKTISKIIKSGVSGIEVLPYMISKHAIERNAYLRENEYQEWFSQAEADHEQWMQTSSGLPQATVDRKIQDFQDEIEAKQAELAKKDYSGVKGFNLDKDGKVIDKTYENDPDGLAQSIVDEFEDKVSIGLIADLWDNTKNASSDIVDFWKNGQSMSEEQAETTKNRYDYFIPLRGWREGAAKQLAYKKGEGFGGSLQKAKGRTSFAENPLAHMEQVAFKAIGEQTDNEVKTALLNLVAGNYETEFQQFYHLKKAYYIKHTMADGTIEWEMTMERPSEDMFASGDAKTKIYNQYQKLRTPTQAHEHEVYVKRPNGDMIIVMSNEMLPVAQAINIRNKRIINSNFKISSTMKKPTSTFWICFSIILVGLLFCGTYYFVNKDNGRYEYDSGLIIDKKTGEAKQIKIKKD